jgi:hypothetical protein
VAEDWEHLQEPGLVHVLITARDESSAYRVFDALVERFPTVGPPTPRSEPPGLVVLAVLAPTLGALPADPVRRRLDGGAAAM